MTEEGLRIALEPVPWSQSEVAALANEGILPEEDETPEQEGEGQ